MQNQCKQIFWQHTSGVTTSTKNKKARSTFQHRFHDAVRILDIPYRCGENYSLFSFSRFETRYFTDNQNTRLRYVLEDAENKAPFVLKKTQTIFRFGNGIACRLSPQKE